MDVQAVTDFYMGLLRGLGYRPALDVDGNIYFRAEADYLYLMISPEEPDCFQLVFPSWTIEAEEELKKAYEVANEANKEQRVGKVVVVASPSGRAYVQAAVEIPVPDVRMMTPELFQICLKTVRAAKGKFVRGMHW